jgi:serine/threonine protein kinase
VLVDDNDRLRVIDFNVSATFGPGDQPLRGLEGTLPYNAPEQFLDVYDERVCDVLGPI